MCFDLDSLPPIPQIAGAAVSHDDVVLGSADGTEFAGFAATPEKASRVGIIVLPDVRGLYRFYEELALRFAERGYGALAIDYFGRTAGVGKRDDDFPYMEHVNQTDPDAIQSDIAAAAAWLRSPAGGSRERIFTVGFCFGGRQSWLAAAGAHGLAGAVGFYGMPGQRNGRNGPIQRASEMDAPILALQAGADDHITAEDNAALERALTKAGVAHEVVTYEGAPHSFFDRRWKEHQAASDDAWARVVAFVEQYA
ncbi:MAG: carboxymethylenebutenolidase [Gaiellales bacterium]|nr:carboxymethylenebutenolidase [Gaiellales bacterium]